MLLAEKASTKVLDWGAVAAWIALIVAIVSPILVAVITNKHQSKMKKAEIMEERGLKAIEEYLVEAIHEIYYTGLSEEYQKRYLQVFLYAPKSSWKDIEELDGIIRKNVPLLPDKNKALPLIKKISKELTYTDICK